MADAKTPKDLLLEEGNPAALSRTPSAGASATAPEERGPPAEVAARRSARRTQALPPLPQPRSRSFPQILLVLLVLWLLVRVGHEREPTRKLSFDEDTGAGPPSQSALGSPPDSGTAPRPFFVPPTVTGQSPSVPGTLAPAAGPRAEEPRTPTAPPGQTPTRRGVLPARPRPGPALHRLLIRAKQEAQLLITIDGQRTIEFHLRPGQARSWSAQRDFILTSKNGGEVALTLNGRQVPPLGNSRQRVRYIRPPALKLDAHHPAPSADRIS